MINKQQLEQLIKDNKPIYVLSGSNGTNIPKIEKYNSLEYAASIIYSFNFNENIYENEDDAKWDMEMSCRETRELKFPTYENYSGQVIRFKHGYDTIEMFVDKSVDDEVIMVNEYPKGNNLFVASLNKENYIKACKLCIKIFKGE